LGNLELKHQREVDEPLSAPSSSTRVARHRYVTEWAHQHGKRKRAQASESDRRRPRIAAAKILSRLGSGVTR
jgi:hypothetical protein